MAWTCWSIMQAHQQRQASCQSWKSENLAGSRIRAGLAVHLLVHCFSLQQPGSRPAWVALYCLATTVSSSNQKAWFHTETMPHMCLQAKAGGAGQRGFILKPCLTCACRQGQDFEEVLATNVVGSFRVTAAFLPLLRLGSQKKIVNVSSTMGSLSLHSKLGAASEQPQHWAQIGLPYCASKAALSMRECDLPQSAAS